eukprot:CAMPEP_0167745882 /NCGR_PEP_ID=MMETSP0110_2-20121227/3397_1 /TAXON_ID=629695 /ORGANISM="Gymnochlora sp., Strain CCMP2014" /LENGTH=575 /DNA_ID=CAMNT_0007630571 /DNA_START=552 /DNA_END=2277 /DNA_ORIENTATION=-
MSFSFESLPLSNSRHTAATFLASTASGRVLREKSSGCSALTRAGRLGFQFVVADLVHPRYNRRLNEEEKHARSGIPLTRSDMILAGPSWTSDVVGRLSDWMNYESKKKSQRTNATDVFLQELRWASHLTLLGGACKTSYVQKQHEFWKNYLKGLRLTGGLKFWIQVPMVAKPLPFEELDFGSSWRTWNDLRLLCEGDHRLGVCLELPSGNEKKNSYIPPKSIIDKWNAEPIKALIIPTKAFTMTKEGIVVLSEEYISMFLRLTNADTRIIISGPSLYAEGHGPYLSVIQNIFESLPGATEQLKIETPYRDFLQSPLQPLMDNLKSQTYEIFEKDPIKYSQYEKAICKALMTKFKSYETVCIVVVGAGRGPLVRCALRAGEKAEKKLRVYAVEKNPNAMITLQNAKLNEWGDKVTVVHADMREWKAPEKADIMVSELLGSFGDNELSPECLDGAQWVIKSDGISIPSDSTSYLQPIAYPKVWGNLNATGLLKSFETPYVVLLHRHVPLAESKAAFSFFHPNDEKPVDNTREITIEFSEAKEENILHGFAGYFESTLFEDIGLSIRPKTFSEGMFSW